VTSKLVAFGLNINIAIRRHKKKIAARLVAVTVFRRISISGLSMITYSLKSALPVTAAFRDQAPLDSVLIPASQGRIL
jgi:hypothetical protein